jgi:hypothetical protein
MRRWDSPYPAHDLVGLALLLVTVAIVVVAAVMVWA